MKRKLTPAEGELPVRLVDPAAPPLKLTCRCWEPALGVRFNMSLVSSRRVAVPRKHFVGVLFIETGSLKFGYLNREQEQNVYTVIGAHVGSRLYERRIPSVDGMSLSLVEGTRNT